MSGKEIESAFQHILSESFLSNVSESLQLEYNRFQKAHDAIHVMMLLPALAIPKDVEYFEKSAFLNYVWEAFHTAHRSCLNALTGHYNAAYSLLRNVYELIIRGSFLECFSDEKYWKNPGPLSKYKKRRKPKRTIIDWISELASLSPSIVDEMRDTSAGIFDKLSILFNDTKFQRKYVQLPSFKAIVELLIYWDIIDIADYVKFHDSLYDYLSKNVHVFPDWTDVGRRLLHEHDWMDVRVIQDELRIYMFVLLEVMDISILIELNMLADWIKKCSQVNELQKLSVRLKHLGLQNSELKLKSLLQN
jgi:hypothetical protein